MGKARLLSCIINTKNRIRKASEIIFFQNDLNGLKENERKVVEELNTKLMNDLYNLRQYIDKVLLFLSIEKQTAIGKPVNKEFLGQKE